MDVLTGKMDGLLCRDAIFCCAHVTNLSCQWVRRTCKLLWCLPRPVLLNMADVFTKGGGVCLSMFSSSPAGIRAHPSRW